MVVLLGACAPGFSRVPNAVEGVASWYGPGFDGRQTASGEIFDTSKLTAAHQTLPFDTLVRVTNLGNGLVVVVRVNDRGPFVDGRIIDLSRAAADRLGFGGKGVARVKVKFLGPARQAANDKSDAPVILMAAKDAGSAGAVPVG